MGDQDRDNANHDIQRQYLAFFDDNNDVGGNYDRIKTMIQKNLTRVVVNINDLRRKNPERCKALLDNGFEEMPLAQRALREAIAVIDTDYVKEKEEFHVGFEGSFGSKHVTPRNLTARNLGNMVCVEGIVTKCSMIRPKIVKSVHYCPATKKAMERRYADVSSFDLMPSTSIYPTKDDDGNLLETEYGLSQYRDHQTMTLQEMPEKAPTGQLPRSVDVVLDNDLVDICKPGDRILLTGVYRCMPGKQGGFTSGVFKALLLANNITQLSKDANLEITKDDIKACKKFSKLSNPFEILARSLAPSIHGHEFIKKAILCLLLGGVEKILKNGTRLRGDINVLLIGDPSVAKSQILRYVSNVSPRVVMTSGRGSSGVGLTAAITTDMETGERRLEAGAMVLADRGIVCIDEFDKMTDADRTAIHEVMEQGRVTIAKAGIHARLNARTSVCAAANPIMGRYDEYKSPMENIGLQDSLLSRFDLLFIVLDTADPEVDRKIADHVLRMNRYRLPGTQDGEATSMFMNEQTLSTLMDDAEKEVKTDVYEKYDPHLHGKSNVKRLSMSFIKKYIHIAKVIRPELTQEASAVIADEYTKLRSLDQDKMARTQPITARSLETMIRLSTAHARARMSKKIEKKDALAAIELVQYAYFKKVLEREKKKKRKGDFDVDFDSDEEETMEETPSKRARSKDPESEPLTESEPLNDTEPPILSEITEMSEPMETDEETQDFITPQRKEQLKDRISNLFALEREESLTIDKVHEWLKREEMPFTQREIDSGLQSMANDGNIMIAEGIVFLI